MSKIYVRAIKLPKENRSLFKNVVPLEDIDSDKLGTIEQIHLLTELRKAVDFKVELLNKRGDEEYKPNFKNKGVMVPDKIEYWMSDRAPVIINIYKESNGDYRVIDA